MCGILGIVRRPGGQIDTVSAQAALNRMRHRGPDDEGYLLADLPSGRRIPCGGPDTDPRLDLPRIESQDPGPWHILLGHRRLSIIDVSPAGHQPMAGAGGRCWLLLNGEIYNYVELRAELARLGHAFTTASDTEVVLAAWREWGPAMLGRFTGMFALALLDLDRRRLFLARDPFGIKPLYYAARDGGFAFASEVKPLLALGAAEPRPDAAALFQYLRFGFTDFGGGTLFAGVRQVPAAHYLELDLADPAPAEPVRYWRIDLARRADIPIEEAARRVRETFEESVRLHLRSDVPVGSCLSGGLDSTAIVLAMSRARGPGQALHAFSYIAEDPAISEEPFVDLVGTAAPLEVHKIFLRAEDLLADLPALIEAQEFPFMSTSIYAQFKVFEAAGAAGITVMLDGQGSDEIFGGYYNLIGARLTALLARGRFGAVRPLLDGAPANMAGHKGRMLAAALGRLLPAAARGPFMALAGEPLAPPWLDSGWFRRQGVEPAPRPQGRGRECLREELLQSVEHLSLPQLLRYEDRNAMRHSIESRVPFCVPALAELALSLPDSHLVGDDGATKRVFKEAVRGLVPEPIRRREKVGFAIPDRLWARALQPWIVERLRSGAAALPCLRPERLRADLDAFVAGGGFGPGALWRCVNLVEWSDRFSVRWDG
jgi:asparagine synthase (glutamine-hydrolysing)